MKEINIKFKDRFEIFPTTYDSNTFTPLFNFIDIKRDKIYSMLITDIYPKHKHGFGFFIEEFDVRIEYLKSILEKEILERDKKINEILNG